MKGPRQQTSFATSAKSRQQKQRAMNTATISRDYLSKIFATMSPIDTTWAIKELTDRLFMISKISDKKAETQETVSQRELPEAVRNMTVRHRKRVSYDTYEDYNADLTAMLEARHA